jgi:hypothetical protein
LWLEPDRDQAESIDRAGVGMNFPSDLVSGAAIGRTLGLGLDQTSRNSFILWREVPSTHLLFRRSFFSVSLASFESSLALQGGPKAHQEDHYEPFGSIDASTVLYRQR